MTENLIPILLSAYGRSGTTGLMATLASDRRIAFDRTYPFENRYLTYLYKFAILTGRLPTASALDPFELTVLSDSRFGPPPWTTDRSDTRTWLMPAVEEWLSGLWKFFSSSVVRRYPESTHYAEKAPHWLAPAVRCLFPSRTIYLVRDPRDVFLSARAFTREKGGIGFGMDAPSEIDQARYTAHMMLGFFENARADQHRADTICVRYEDFVTHPAETTRRLGSFLGLQLSAERVQEVAQLDRHKTSASLTASIGKWRSGKLPDTVRLYLERELHELMSTCGYELSSDSNGPLDVPLDDPVAHSAHGTFSRTGQKTLAVTVTGEDFFLELPCMPVAANRIAEVWACVRGDTGTRCSLYWRGQREPFSEERAIHVPFIPGQHWEIVRFPVAHHPGWRGTVEQLRIDLFNGTVIPGKGGELRWIRCVA
jgi:hypothetical protein